MRILTEQLNERLSEQELDNLQWAKDFLSNYEKKKKLNARPT